MNKKIPLRMCIGCQEMKDKRELLRIYRDEEGNFAIDTTGRKNGRGAYVCKSTSCIEMSVKNHGLERSFKTKIDKETYNKLIEEMKSIEE